MTNLILSKSPGSAESSVLHSLVHSVANSFQKPHCLSRTLLDLLCLELAQPSATVRTVILRAHDEHLGLPLAQNHQQFLTKQGQMPIGFEALYWPLWAERKTGSEKKVFLGFSSWRSINTRLYLILSQFLKIPTLPSSFPLGKIQGFVLIVRKIGQDLKGP